MKVESTVQRKCSPKNSHLIYTPRHRIPLGEAILTSDGRLALRIKKPRGEIVETITLEHFFSLVASGLSNEQNAGSPSEDVAS